MAQRVLADAKVAAPLNWSTMFFEDRCGLGQAGRLLLAEIGLMELRHPNRFTGDALSLEVVASWMTTPGNQLAGFTGDQVSARSSNASIRGLISPSKFFQRLTEDL